jgi:hypothetical protein
MRYACCDVFIDGALTHVAKPNMRYACCDVFIDDAMLAQLAPVIGMGMADSLIFGFVSSVSGVRADGFSCLARRLPGRLPRFLRLLGGLLLLESLLLLRSLSRRAPGGLYSGLGVACATSPVLEHG